MRRISSRGGIYEDRRVSLSDRHGRPGRGRPPLDRRLRGQSAQRGDGQGSGDHAGPQPRDAGGRDPCQRPAAGSHRRGLARLLQAGVHDRHEKRRRRPLGGPPGVVPPARSLVRHRHRARQVRARLRGLRRALWARRRSRHDRHASRHARRRGRHRRHPGRSRDRRRRQAGLPRRAYRHHRRSHGDVRQDLPDPRLRRLHPHPEDGGGGAARDDRPDDLLGGRGGVGVAGGLHGQGAQEGTPRGHPRLRGLQRLHRGLPSAHAQRVRQRHRRAQGRLHALPAGGAQRLPRGRPELHLRTERRRQVRRVRQEVPQGLHRSR